MRYINRTMTLQAAIRDLKHPKPLVRVQAVEALGKARVEDIPEAVKALRPLLRDDSPDVRFMAALCLGKLRDSKSVKRLIAMMKEDGEPLPRQAATTALGEIGDPKAEKPLVRALKSEYPDVRFQATISLTQVAPKTAAKPLREALRDEDPEVRGNAAAALGDIKDVASADLLFEMLDDPDTQVKAESTLALSRLGDQRAIEPLIELLDHSDYKLLAAEQLFQNPAQKSIPALKRLLSKWFIPPQLKIYASGALLRLGDERGKETLLDALKSKKQDLKGLCIQILGQVGSAWCQDVLEKKLKTSKEGELEMWREELSEALDHCRVKKTKPTSR